MYDFSKVSFENSDCERCFDCVSACPRGVLEASPTGPIIAHPEECMGCRVCLGVCRQMGLRMVFGPYLESIGRQYKMAC